jgi:hypothetical protein
VVVAGVARSTGWTTSVPSVGPGDGDRVDRLVEDPIDPRGDVPSGDGLLTPGGPDGDVDLAVHEQRETILRGGNGDEGRYAGGILVGQQTGELATQDAAHGALLPTALDDVEYPTEHGTLPRLPRRDQHGGAAETGGHALAWACPPAVVIQAGHDPPTPLAELRRPTTETTAASGSPVDESGRLGPANDGTTCAV